MELSGLECMEDRSADSCIHDHVKSCPYDHSLQKCLPLIHVSDQDMNETVAKIPQLSRILGLPRQLIKRILSS